MRMPTGIIADTIRFVFFHYGMHATCVSCRAVGIIGWLLASQSAPVLLFLLSVNVNLVDAIKHKPYLLAGKPKNLHILRALHRLKQEPIDYSIVELNMQCMLLE